MNFEEILEFRYACKRFKKDENIPTSDIDKIINAANLTPTSCNKTPLSDRSIWLRLCHFRSREY